MNKNRKAGFTLAELLVTVIIILILSSVSFVGVAAYRKSLKLLEMDGIARELFIAAQNHLSMEKSKGTLDILKSSGADLGAAGSSSDGAELHTLVYAGTAPKSGADIREYILPFGAIDPAVRDAGSYLIRYNLETGIVREVFYSDSYEFGTEADTELERAKTDKELRKNFGTRKQVIGYYGGEDLGVAPGELPELSVPVLSVENGSRLSAVIRYKKENAAAPEAELRLVVRGESSGKTVRIPLDTDNLSRFGGSSAPFDSNGTEYRLVLDDITAAGRHFAELFGDTGLIPGENITLSAEAGSSSTLAAIQESNAVKTNSLYGDSAARADGESFKAEVSISNIRHLENLSPAISGIGSRYLAETAVQGKALDWKDFAEGLGLGATAENLTISYYGGTGSGTAFQPLMLDYDLLYDGKNNKISNLFISGAQDAGLFGRLEAGRSLTVRDLELIDASVRTSGENVSAGTLMGRAEGSLTVRNVLSKSMEKTVQASGSGSSAGGLIGAATGNTSLDGTAAVVYVEADAYAGGLIGRLGGGPGAGAYSVSRSYAGGHTYNGSYLDTDEAGRAGRYNVISRNGTAGGLAGYADPAADISYSYATSSVQGKNDAHSLVGEGYLQENGGSVYALGRVKKAGSPSSDALNASDGKSDGSAAAYPYDAKLKGKYPYKTVAQLDPSGAGSGAYFLSGHVGDWVISEHRVSFVYAEEGFVPAGVTKTREPKSGLVYFKEGGDLSEQTVSDGDAAYLPIPDSIDGRRLLYWSWDGKDKNGITTEFRYDPGTGSIKAYRGGNEVTGSPSPEPLSSIRAVTETMLVRAHFEKRDYADFIYRYVSVSGKETEGWLGRRYKDDSGDISVPPVPKLGGYEFRGWYTDKNAAEGDETSRLTLTDNKVRDVPNGTTVYALYKNIKSYQVRIEFRYRAVDGAELYRPYVYNMVAGKTMENERIILPAHSGRYTLASYYKRQNSVLSGPYYAEEDNFHITASDETVFIMVYTGTPINYQVKHIFHDTEEANVSIAAEASSINTEGFAFSEGRLRTVVQTKQGNAGLFTDAQGLEAPGFKLTASIVNKRIEENGTTAVELHYYRETYTLYYDLDSGKYSNIQNGTVNISGYIPPKTVRYGERAALPGSPELSRLGYSLRQMGGNPSCWDLYAADAAGRPLSDRISSGVTEVSSMPSRNVYAKALWTPNATASVKVEIFRQKVSDPINLGDQSKSYDYQSSTILNNFRTGVAPSAAAVDSALRGQGIATSYAHFTRNTTRSQYPAVEPDGSTVVRLYYDRDIMTISFSSYSRFLGYDRWGRPLYETLPGFFRQGLYEAEIDFEWPSVNGTAWRYAANQGLSFLGNYQWDDIGTVSGNTLNLWAVRTNYSWVHTMRFLKENMTRTAGQAIPANAGSYRLSNSYETQVANFTLTNKYLGYELYGYNRGGSEQIIPAPVNTTIRQNGDSSVYFRRKEYRIDFTNQDNSLLSSRMLLYQEALNGNMLPAANTVPRPADLDSDYVFQGWYSSPSGRQEELIADAAGNMAVNFSMPANNLQLFACWKAPEKAVQLYLDPVQNPGNYVSVEIEREKILKEGLEANGKPELLEPGREGYRFGGWYRDYDAVKKEYRNPYILNTKITEPLKLYAKWEKVSGQLSYTVVCRRADDKTELLRSPLQQDIYGAQKVVKAPEYIDNPGDQGYQKLRGLYPTAPNQAFTLNTDGMEIVFEYREIVDPWKYTVEIYHRYTDINNPDRKAEALISREEIETEEKQVIYRPVNKEGYVLSQDSSSAEVVRDDNATHLIRIYYEPALQGIQTGSRSKLYDALSSETTLILPGEMQGRINQEIRRSSVFKRGNTVLLDAEGQNTAPVNAGAYTEELSLMATDGTETVCFWKSPSLTINIQKRTLVLRSVDSEKPYTGELLMPEASAILAEGDGFAGGEGAEYRFLAGYRDVGVYSGIPFMYTMKENTLSGNYTVTMKPEGKFTIKEPTPSSP